MQRDQITHCNRNPRAASAERRKKERSKEESRKFSQGNLPRPFVIHGKLLPCRSMDRLPLALSPTAECFFASASTYLEAPSARCEAQAPPPKLLFALTLSGSPYFS